MHENYLAEVEARVSKTTPSPWYPIMTDDRLFMTAKYVGLDLRGKLNSTGLYVDEEPDQILIDEKVDSERLIATTCLQSPRVVWQDDGGANAVFIARARDDVPALISEIRRLNKLLTEK